ncbi:hypothetical protein AB9T89_15980 [Flavobacterium oncorhynchi]|uniref:hypothetical protein n=1 Tax=Flavobacterium oncorhynchi TaxID=728056 RepID=UPI00351A295D
MKKYIFGIIFLFSFIFVKAQVVRPYVGVATYFHTDFSSSVFLSLKSGAEFGLNKYVKPEVEISGIIGALEDFTKKDENNRIIEEYTRSVTSINFSFCPKIILGNSKELDSYFVILPKFSISNIEAHGNLTTYNNMGVLIANQRKIVKDWNQSVGFGVGYNFNLSLENPDSLCIILDLQGVELGDAVNELNNSNNRTTTKWTFGLGLNYYFNFFKKKV